MKKGSKRVVVRKAYSYKRNGKVVRVPAKMSGGGSDNISETQNSDVNLDTSLSPIQSTIPNTATTLGTSVPTQEQASTVITPSVSRADRLGRFVGKAVDKGTNFALNRANKLADNPKFQELVTKIDKLDTGRPQTILNPSSSLGQQRSIAAPEQRITNLEEQQKLMMMLLQKGGGKKISKKNQKEILKILDQKIESLEAAKSKDLVKLGINKKKALKTLHEVRDKVSKSK